MLVFEVKEEPHLTCDRVFIGRSGACLPLVHSHLGRQQSPFYCLRADALRSGQDSQVPFRAAWQSLQRGRASAAARRKAARGEHRRALSGLWAERERARHGLVRSAGKGGSWSPAGCRRGLMAMPAMGALK